MAYRRKRGTPQASTFEDFRSTFAVVVDDDDFASTPTSLAAQAIRASAAQRESTMSSTVRDPMRQRSVSFHQDSVRHEYMSMRSMNERSTNESRYGFWGVLARKARSILEEDNKSRQLNDNSRNEFETVNSEAMGNRLDHPKLPESTGSSENLASSLNYIGGTIRNALEDGLTRVENRTAGIIQEKLQRKSVSFNPRSKMTDAAATKNISQHLSDQENQLKSSRDLANAMAAKVKILLRELKTVKADLAFAKERCTQLEEENKLLRESRQKGDNTEDDDLIRLQLETLLAEKGRLAQENFLYAQENRFLREIVEYHQLTMQDFVQLDDDDITELNKIGHMQMSSPRSSSQPASEVLSPVTSSTHTPPVPISPPSQNSNVEAESSSVAGPLSSILPASSKESPRWKRSPSTP